MQKFRRTRISLGGIKSRNALQDFLSHSGDQAYAKRYRIQVSCEAIPAFKARLVAELKLRRGIGLSKAKTL